MEILERAKAENGNDIQIIYDKYEFGKKYKLCFKSADEYNFRIDSASDSYDEAVNRFNKMKGEQK